MPLVRRDYDVYANELCSLGHGLALHDPTPNPGAPPVQIGDVGNVVNGQFIRAFNIFYPPDHIINRYGVPPGFEQADTQFRETRVPYPLAGPLYSENVMPEDGAESLIGYVTIIS